MRDILLGTGNSQLIEFSRSAKRTELAGSPEMWAGYVDDGKLYGENWMGQIHMHVRKLIADGNNPIKLDGNPVNLHLVEEVKGDAVE